MDDQDKARLAKLLQRQQRRRGASAVLQAWAERGVTVSALGDVRSEELISWLRAHWRVPDETVSDFQDSLRSAVGDEEWVVLVDLWNWEHANAVVLPRMALLRAKDGLREIYPDGFAVLDQQMERALVVNFDEHVDGAEIAVVASSPKSWMRGLRS